MKDLILADSIEIVLKRMNQELGDDLGACRYLKLKEVWRGRRCKATNQMAGIECREKRLWRSRGLLALIFRGSRLLDGLSCRCYL